MPDTNERFADLLGRMTGAICAGYARYDFSYTSKIAGSEGRRAGFSGIACCELREGLIRRYSEVFERAQVLARLGFTDQRIVESVRRWAAKEG